MGKRFLSGLKYEDIIKYSRHICLICVIAFGIITVAASGGGGGDNDADSPDAADTAADTNTDTTDLYDNDNAVYTIDSLAVKLEENADTDAEKSRAIWLWITNNIAYDVDIFLSGASGGTSAEETLENRKSICEGYANLFYALAVAMDLEATVITGYAKGYGYVEGQALDSPNHVWNAVKIDGDWQLLDATWGAGVIDSNQEFVENYDESWYMPDPEHFIFSHLPENEQWQLLGTPIAKTRFEELPDLSPVFFSWGFTPQDVYDAVDSGTYRGIVKQYDLNQDRDEVEIVDAPIDLYLDAGTEYTFVIRIPDSLAVGLYNETKDTWYWCHEYNDTGDLPPYGDTSNYTGVDSGVKSDDGTYTFSIKPEEGDLMLTDMYLSNGTSQTLLQYIVE